MEGPYLPEGSGGEEPPEEPSQEISERAFERALHVYEERLFAFEKGLESIMRSTMRRRKSVRDYITKNCEEALGERNQKKDGMD